MEYELLDLASSLQDIHFTYSTEQELRFLLMIWSSNE
jgi:hypothetical protein